MSKRGKKDGGEEEEVGREREGERAQEVLPVGRGEWGGHRSVLGPGLGFVM
jgi:hypothetical protein